MSLLPYLEFFKQAQAQKAVQPRNLPYNTRERQGQSSGAPFSIPKPVTTIGSHLAGNAISNAITGSGASAVATPTVLNGTQVATPGLSSTMGGLGASAGLAGMAYAVGDNFLQDGGKDVLTGKGSASQTVDAGLNTNPLTGWINPAGKALGLGTVGGIFGGKSLKQKNAEDLKNNVWDKGIRTHHTPGQSIYDTANKSGNVDSRAANDFTGLQDGEWINNKFANSRNVADLQAEDVWGSTDIYKAVGNDWLEKLTEDERRQASQEGLTQGMFSEGGGKVGLKDGGAFKAIVEGILANRAAATSTASKAPRVLASKTNVSSSFDSAGKTKDAKKKPKKPSLDIFNPAPTTDPNNSASVAVAEFAKALKERHRYV